MKKNNKWLFTIFTLFALLCVSCNNFLSNQNLNKLENEVPAGKTAKLYFNVNASSARSVVPDTSLANFSNLVLTGVLNNSGTPTSLGNWDSVQAMLNSSIDISTGKWNLTLSAKKASADFSASKEINITAGEAATVSFVLQADNSTTGLADITLRYPANSDITSVYWKFEQINSSSSNIRDMFDGPSETGTCWRNSSTGGVSQSLTDTTFTLQKSLPPGKYFFSCDFRISYGSGTHDYTSLGEYHDYIIIQRGFESKIDYTIDYFEYIGITSAVSNPNGIELTLDVPKGAQDILIIRINDYDEMIRLQQAQSTGNPPVDLYTIIQRRLPNPARSHTTYTFTDSYGFEKDKTLAYAVYFDYQAFSSIVKAVTVDYDPVPAPEFTTYPEFATELDQNGVTNKIKITNNPVVDWHGLQNNNNYTVSLSTGEESYFSFLMPDYIFSPTVKECVIEDELIPGTTKLEAYIFSYDKDGWNYSLVLDTSTLTGSQLPPVLQGPSPAVATDQGIAIRVYCDRNVSLLRATSLEALENNQYTTVVSNAWGNDYFEYVDRRELVAGTTYYYKVVDWQGKTYGGDYFTATATVTTAPPIIITTNPKISVSNKGLATLTPGNYQIADYIQRYNIEYVYVWDSDPDEIMRISQELYYDEGIWKIYTIKAVLYTGYYQKSFLDSVSSFDSPLDLHKFDTDGCKYNFVSATIRCYENNDYFLSEEKLLNLNAEDYTARIEIPKDRMELVLEATDQGVLLKISNIPEEANSIIVSSYVGQYLENDIFDVRNIDSTSITLLDSYVSAGNLYSYRVTANSPDTGTISTAQSKNMEIEATGGAGEFPFTVSNVSNGIKLDYTLGNFSNVEISRVATTDSWSEGYNYTPKVGSSSFIDYFVEPEEEYFYTVHFSADYGDPNVYYYPQHGGHYITAIAGTGMPDISTLPTFTYDAEERKIIFEGDPQLSNPGLTQNQITLLRTFYRLSGGDNTIYMNYTNDKYFFVNPYSQSEPYILDSSYAWIEMEFAECILTGKASISDTNPDLITFVFN